ncbi:glycosyltransferase family 2 protein [Enterovibrio norvegicus]|uniref:glycosyltransferase family 2 protein n=1 Tax=Enterovibrio norvegicus TaxID=188144 RepID=UPI000C832344|nr:glycosyltransferase family 2 protein [Enterovibrio norvegicus]PMH71556.1 hypothetical protein BCU62_24810 [Enterovibrio norvegicus]
MIKELAVCILTLNEENNISKCIESVKCITNDIHVLDSGSEDNTRNIVISNNVKLYTNIQSGVYSAAVQRNWAIRNINSEAKWILFVDADEVISERFVKSIIEVLDSVDVDVISIPLIYYFHDKKIRSMGYPNWHDRIVRRHVSFSASVGEFVDTDKRKYVKEAVIKHEFNSLGMRRFFEKQARYAEYIGMQTNIYLEGGECEYFDKKDGNSKLKRSVVKLGLFRPLLRFIYQYFYKRGFTEGRSGFIVSLYMAIFELMVVVSSIEDNRNRSNKNL